VSFLARAARAARHPAGSGPTVGAWTAGDFAGSRGPGVPARRHVWHRAAVFRPYGERASRGTRLTLARKIRAPGFAEPYVTPDGGG